jgi:hypothetical protein
MDSKPTSRILAWIACLALPMLAAPVIAAPARADDDGWIVECPLSHSLMDDPIVYPHQPGASHRHDFFGAKSTDAFSTVKSMRRDGTTCGLKADTAGYWLPALYRNGQRVRPQGGDTEQVIYYRNDLDSSEHITVPPKNLQMVVGNRRARSPAGNPLLGTSKMYFNCNDGEGPQAQVAKPPVCDDGILVLHVRFPQCWDGEHVDSPDHISHMAFVDEGDTCPSSHPVAIPRVTIRAEYPVGRHYHPNNIKFASGPYYTVHGDFWQTWHMDKLRTLIRRCFHGHKDCGTFEPGD